MNELDKIIELAGIIVGAADSRDKKDDAGITIDDMPVQGEESPAQTIPDDHEVAFSIDQSHDDEGYEDLGLGLGEKLGKNTSAGEWIGDFEKSDDPRFSGDSKEQRKNRALGAYYGSQDESAEMDEDIQRMKHLAGMQEADEDDVEINLPPAKERGAKPEPDYEKEYDKNLNWWGKDDVEEGIDDEEGEIVDFEPSADVEDDDMFSDKPRVRGARPEPDFSKKYDDWYWSGKGEKFAEEDDLSNGYGNEETFDADIMFPNGFDSPIQHGKGPASAKQGDNPLARQNKMAVTESIKKSLYQELINFKK